MKYHLLNSDGLRIDNRNYILNDKEAAILNYAYSLNGVDKRFVKIV